MPADDDTEDGGCRHNLLLQQNQALLSFLTRDPDQKIVELKSIANIAAAICALSPGVLCRAYEPEKLSGGVNFKGT